MQTTTIETSDVPRPTTGEVPPIIPGVPANVLAAAATATRQHQDKLDAQAKVVDDEWAARKAVLIEATTARLQPLLQPLLGSLPSRWTVDSRAHDLSDVTLVLAVGDRGTVRVKLAEYLVLVDVWAWGPESADDDRDVPTLFSDRAAPADVLQVALRAVDAVVKYVPPVRVERESAPPPRPISVGDRPAYPTDSWAGMTMRDRFALAALGSAWITDRPSWADTAAIAYEVADALLAERTKPAAL